MPYRKFKKPGRVTRRGRRKYRGKRTATNAMGPLTNTLKTKMIYHDEFNLDVGVGGTIGSYVFTANGLYDPNITGVGHQPRGFDQVTPLYDHYVVIASKIYLTVVNSDSGNGAIVALLAKDTATALGTVDDVLENRYVKYTSLSAEGSGVNNKTISMALNPNKFLGRSKPMSDPELKGGIAANPTEQVYFHCYVMPAPGGVDTGTVYAHARIEYTAIWVEPKQPTSS